MAVLWRESRVTNAVDGRVFALDVEGLALLEVFRRGVGPRVHRPWEAYRGDERIGSYASAEEAKRAAISWLRAQLRAGLNAIAGEEGQTP